MQLDHFDGGTTLIHRGADQRIERLRTPGGLNIHYSYDAEDRLSAVDCGAAYSWHYEYDDKDRLIGIVQVPRGEALLVR